MPPPIRDIARKPSLRTAPFDRIIRHNLHGASQNVHVRHGCCGNAVATNRASAAVLNPVAAIEMN
jgi:hypothetical protein